MSQRLFPTLPLILTALVYGLTAIGRAIADADEFLADHDWMDWDMLEEEDRQMVNKWKGMFEEYNEGETGPGHCDDDDEDTDDVSDDMN